MLCVRGHGCTAGALTSTVGACVQVDWSELFSDLVMVAVALRISASIKADLSWATLGLLVAEFYCLFFSWSDLAGVYTATV
jgi:low temperature requirement protein LtrA